MPATTSPAAGEGPAAAGGASAAATGCPMRKAISATLSLASQWLAATLRWADIALRGGWTSASNLEHYLGHKWPWENKETCTLTCRLTRTHTCAAKCTRTHERACAHAAWARTHKNTSAQCAHAHAHAATRTHTHTGTRTYARAHTHSDTYAHA